MRITSVTFNQNAQLHHVTADLSRDFLHDLRQWSGAADKINGLYHTETEITIGISIVGIEIQGNKPSKAETFFFWMNPRRKKLPPEVVIYGPRTAVQEAFEIATKTKDQTERRKQRQLGKKIWSVIT